MRTKRTPDEWRNWRLAKNRIDKELNKYYRACMTEELAPRYTALLEKLDNEIPEEQN